MPFLQVFYSLLGFIYQLTNLYRSKEQIYLLEALLCICIYSVSNFYGENFILYCLENNYFQSYILFPLNLDKQVLQIIIAIQPSQSTIKDIAVSSMQQQNTQYHPKYDIEVKKDLIGKITFHQQLNVESKNRGMEPPSIKKVFILLTGGTIGMFPNSQGKYAPARDRFQAFLKKYQYFCDEDQTYFNGQDGFIITPPSIGGYPIFYKYFELKDLIDSTNMNIQRLNMILSKIQEVYNQYDAFIILHGTDTMAYTSSALSFMIENLKKTIIITGAQIPIGQPRNDAVNNLLCSLTIAGHYSIPQVLVIFDNKILRGNRTTKFSTSSFQAFKSPNFYPIGQLGLTVSIKWQKIFPCNYQLPTTFIKLQQQVQIQKLTPYGYQTAPSSKYVIIESFGIGNIPTEGAFHEWAVQNSKLPEEQRKIMVNISQVFQSVIKNTYETGQMALKLGLIPGSDMTCQAAISKLSYLVSKGFKTFQELNQLMGKNLRGQLTEQQDRFTKQKQNYILNCMTVLDRYFGYRTKKQKQILIHIIFPTIILQKPSKAALNRLFQHNFDPHKVFPDGSNLIHRLMRVSHHNLQAEYELVLDMLLRQNVNPNVIDNYGNSALFYGIESANYQAVSKLRQKGGIVKTNASRIFKAIGACDVQLLHGLFKFGDTFQYVNNQGRNCAFISVIKKQEKMIGFFKQFTTLFQEQGLQVKDIYGFTLSFYVQKFGYADLISTQDAPKKGAYVSTKSIQNQQMRSLGKKQSIFN